MTFLNKTFKGIPESLLDIFTIFKPPRNQRSRNKMESEREKGSRDLMRFNQKWLFPNEMSSCPHYVKAARSGWTKVDPTPESATSCLLLSFFCSPPTVLSDWQLVGQTVRKRAKTHTHTHMHNHTHPPQIHTEAHIITGRHKRTHANIQFTQETFWITTEGKKTQV